MTVKVKLITSYKDAPAGTIYETDKEKAEQLVSLKRAEWVIDPSIALKKEQDRLAKIERQAQQKADREKAIKDKATKQMKPSKDKRGYRTK